MNEETKINQTGEQGQCTIQKSVGTIQHPNLSFFVS
jgi:hypothetical protein